MQNLVIFICSRDVETAFIKGKKVLSANQVAIKLERICKYNILPQ